MRRLLVKSILVVSISLTTILSGCMMVPMMIGSNMGNTTHTIVVSGSRFPGDIFRDAAIRAGGVVTVSTQDYAKAEFSAAAVKVELQTVKPGEYQLFGSSNAGSMMPMKIFNDVSETTQKIADQLAANDFTILGHLNHRGM